jgi:MFS transporter, MHS family, shikimate and dehydroshikimate transport protein
LGTSDVASLDRPSGGIVFGHFGDRIGRKAMLVITLLLMGGATFKDEVVNDRDVLFYILQVNLSFCRWRNLLRIKLKSGK